MEVCWKKDVMTMRILILKHWSDQPNSKMLSIAEGNLEVKRKKIAKSESDCKMSDRIKKEKKVIKG